MQEIIVAAIIGASLGNSYACIFLIIGWCSSDKRAGVKFIAGRTMGLFAIGLILWAFASVIPSGIEYPITVIFGIATIIYGIWIVNKHSGFRFLFRHKPSDDDCSGECNQSNAMKKHAGGTISFTTGLIRGITPCVKLFVLVPMLLAAHTSILLGIAVLGAFVLTSTIYPVIGYFSAEIIRSSIKKRHLIEIVGGLIVIGVGIYYLLYYPVVLPLIGQGG